MDVTVEFVGVSRVVTRKAQVSLRLETGTTFRQILHRLGTLHPELVGEVIHCSLEFLNASNMFNVSGKRMVQPGEMDQCPVDGDRLILMSILAGG